MHKIYIASGLMNWRLVRDLWNKLAEYDIFPTYDWTEHGEKLFGDSAVLNSSNILSPEKLKDIGWNELVGVLEADYLLVILPGERGTHVELGAYYARCICHEDTFREPTTDLPITIVIGDDTANKPTSFHYMAGIKRTADVDMAFRHILEHFNKK